MRASIRFVAPLGALLLGLSACGTQSFYVRVMRPAPVNLGQYSLIAVDRFEGDGGSVFGEELADALSHVQNPLTGKLAFQILARRDVDRMLDDLRRRRANDMDQGSLSLLQKWKAADVVLSGTVHLHAVEEVMEQAEFVDKKGHPHQSWTRRCAADVTVDVEATDKANQVFDQVRLQDRAAVATSAVDEEPDLIDHESVLAATRAKVVQSFLRRILPREDWVQVHLYQDGDHPDLRVGNGYAKTGNWEAALQSYRQALTGMQGELVENRYMALHNIGIALSYTNRFAEARKALEEAYALAQDGMILSEIQKVNLREQEFARLQEQGPGRAAAPVK